MESRAEAQDAIAAGLVTVDGAPALKPAAQVHGAQALVVHAPPRTHVSRGGDKLAHGLDRFGVDPAGRRCLDVGASTGGFTDCLLQRGARAVLAVDVGYGQLHERLRRDERVEVRERTNIRDLSPADVPFLADLVVCDVSFIGLTAVLGTVRGLAEDDAEAVVLVKPQFEAGREQVGRGGVVRDPQVWREVLVRVVAVAAEVGWPVHALTASPLTGPAGNVEFLAHLAPPPAPEVDVDAAIAEGRLVAEGRG